MQPQPIYIFYPPQKQSNLDHEVKESEKPIKEAKLEQKVDSKSSISSKPKIEFYSTKNNQISKLEEEEVPMDIGETSPKHLNAPKLIQVDQNANMTVKDHEKKVPYSNPIDDRPIKPIKNSQFYPTELNPVPERIKYPSALANQTNSKGKLSLFI